MELLGGKWALVTGASRGIGAAVARAFAGAGASLFVSVRSDAAVDVTSELRDLGAPEVHALGFDVTDHDAVREAFGKIAALGALDVLVNCAGVMSDAPLAMTRSDDLRGQYEVNLVGTFICCQYASRLMMRRRGGSIVNLGSRVGLSGSPGQAAYAASKAAVHGLTLSLAKELGPLGIRVNAIAPGFICTDLTAGYDKERRTAIAAATSLRRLGSPEDVANAALFLASDMSAYVTGQVLPVDGGMP